jgi:hypothetical protein
MDEDCGPASAVELMVRVLESATVGEFYALREYLGPDSRYTWRLSRHRRTGRDA